MRQVENIKPGMVITMEVNEGTANEKMVIVKPGYSDATATACGARSYYKKEYLVLDVYPSFVLCRDKDGSSKSKTTFSVGDLVVSKYMTPYPEKLEVMGDE